MQDPQVKQLQDQIRALRTSFNRAGPAWKCGISSNSSKMQGRAVSAVEGLRTEVDESGQLLRPHFDRYRTMLMKIIMADPELQGLLPGW